MKSLTDSFDTFSDGEKFRLKSATHGIYLSSPTIQKAVDEGFMVRVKDVVRIVMDDGKICFFIVSVHYYRDESSSLLTYMIDDKDNKQIHRSMVKFYKELFMIDKRPGFLNVLGAKV